MPYKDKEKQKQAQRESHLRNQDERRRRARERKQIVQGEIRKLKSESPCTDCSGIYPFYVMQFDHVRGEKVGDISTLLSNRQFKKAWEEIEKCEVVCANCHAARTYERQPRGEDSPRFIA